MNIFHWPELLTFSIFPSSSRLSRSLSSVTSLRDSRARVFSSSSWSVTPVRDSSSSVSWFLWRNSRLLWERSSSHELKTHDEHSYRLLALLKFLSQQLSLRSRSPQRLQELVLLFRQRGEVCPEGLDLGVVLVSYGREIVAQLTQLRGNGIRDLFKIKSTV